MKKFTQDHEWIEVHGDVGTVGITHHAQEALGDIVFVELPEVGKVFAVGDEAAVIESVKAAGEVKNPAAGEIIEVNQALVDEPSLVNQDAEGSAWMYKIRLSNPDDLAQHMDESAYQAFIS